MTNPPHPIVIVGAGFGGLAAAVRLRAMGHRVLVLEAGPSAGGRARSFDRDGFSFDAGPTVITAPYLFDELFAAAGRDRRDYFDLLPVDPFYRVELPDGGRFDYVGDEERLIEQIAAIHPPDVDGYRALARHAERIFDIGYTELADAPFERLSDMLRIVPDLVRLSSWRSVYALVSRYLRDERLRRIFSFQPLLIGGNPFRTPGIYLLIHWLERRFGVHYARGGTAAIVASLVALLDEMGVEVRTGSAVERIETRGGAVAGVLLQDGRYVATPMVVCNADPSFVYTRLLPSAARRVHTDRAVANKRHSMSLFVGYFGTSRRYPGLAHHTIVLGQRYRELLEDIFERKVLADDFSLYLHAPARTDPAMAPPGCESFYVLSPVPNQASGIDWEEKAEAYFDAVAAHLEERLLPELGASIVTRFHVDPRYFQGALRSYAGAAFGPEPRLTQSAYFRYHNASEDVGGLYFVGAGTHPGAGVPGVLCSAKVLERIAPRPSDLESARRAG